LKRSIALAIDNIESKIPLANLTSQEIELQQDSFFIKKKNKLQKVSLNEIYYLESDGHYCRVHTSSEMYHIRKTMKEVIAKLPSANFVQCHRSYIVNIDRIKSVDLEDDCLVMEERKIPLSRREKERVLERLNLL